MRYVNIYSSARWVAEYETYHILTPEDISDIDTADAIMIRFPVIFKNKNTHIWTCCKNLVPSKRMFEKQVPVWLDLWIHKLCVFSNPHIQAYVSIEKQKDGNMQFYSTFFTLVKASLDSINRFALFI